MANSNASEFAHTYTTFSGCDIVCSFGSQVIGELQGISYSITREKAPVYTMGNADPRSFSRGKRGIAGTLVFVSFNRDALLAGLSEHIKANKIFRRIGGTLNTKAVTIEDWDKQMEDTLNGVSNSGTTTGDAAARTKAISEAADPVVADEIPPFDITISMANEYGAAAVMVIYGVEILNEGMQFSSDIIQSQKACTFAARRIKSLEAVDLSAA